MKREVKDVHIYFPTNVLQKLKKLAERNRRSVSAEIVIAVESHIGNSKPHEDTPRVRRELLPGGTQLTTVAYRPNSTRKLEQGR